MNNETTKTTTAGGSPLDGGVRPGGLCRMVERMRGFERDHEPHGGPAVQMREISALCTAIETMRLAIKMQVLNIERWLQTGVAAGPEESRDLYERLCAAIGRAPLDVRRLTDAELADCGLLSELDE
jgi:hypothetical protein